MRWHNVLAGITTIFFASSVLADKNYDAQIDALQNEILKIKQAQNTPDKNQAYFKKGKGLSIESIDGKYSFQLKGRIMYDMAGVLSYERDDAGTVSDVAMDNGWGSEFRRLRFSIKGEVGDGWGFAFQPDFADGGDDSSDRKVVFKDALIYKKWKGVGKFTFGNQKAAAGLYENTSSNNLIFMERPMHNEVMNFGHRAGIGYDSAGAFGPWHLKTTLFNGKESAIEQNLSDGESGNETYGASMATHYTHKVGDWSLLGGFHYGYWNVSNINGTLDTPNGARAQGVHTLVDKVVDFGNLTDLDSLQFFGPQMSVIWNKNLLVQAEYQKGQWDFTKTTGGLEHDALEFQGGSIGAAYQVYGSGKFKHSAKKGALSGFKCKSHCTMVKYQYEFIDATDQPYNSMYSENRGGSGQAHTLGINHYFNSNVRLMAEYAHGNYGNDNTQSGADTTMNTMQLRLHLKY